MEKDSNTNILALELKIKNLEEVHLLNILIFKIFKVYFIDLLYLSHEQRLRSWFFAKQIEIFRSTL